MIYPFSGPKKNKKTSKNKKTQKKLNSKTLQINKIGKSLADSP